MENNELKMLRKSANKLGIGLILYSVISMGIVVVNMIIILITECINDASILENEAMTDAILEKYGEFGFSAGIGVVLGTLFLVFFFRKQIKLNEICVNNKSMNVNSFLKIFCVFIGIQLISEIVCTLMEYIFNIFGYSIMDSIESMSSVSESMGMFIYASIIAPIIEEIVYRGFVLKTFQKYGKVFAIISSAILFGIMHGNLPQSIFACAAGIILGYVAVEYSIKWSIALHFFNNCIFSDSLGFFIKKLPLQAQETVLYVIMSIFTIAGISILIKNREGVKGYIQENKSNKKLYICTFTAIAIIIFIIMEMAMAISDITVLN